MFRERTSLILGSDGMEKLKNSTVAVYGLGGVGAAAAISLVRCGVGTIAVTDFDTVNESNLNRLIFGYNSTLGMSKTETFIKFAKDINPDVNIISSSNFVHGDDAADNVHKADFHIDAIDSLNPKINLIISLIEKGFPFISSMGTGGKLEPEKLQISDIWKTDVCPLAKFVRKRLRNRNIKAKFPVVFSTEKPVDPVMLDEEKTDEEIGRVRKTQGSTPFVPQAAGLMLASYAVRKLIS
jgi:tRNA A37 threonylcarbamoyladenosine dehydratase